MSSRHGANTQKAFDIIMDQRERGIITVEEANIQLVEVERFRIVTRLSRDIRKTLNNAVRQGRLGHMRKDGLMPEMYYHPTFKHLANQERRRIAEQGIAAIKKICI